MWLGGDAMTIALCVLGYLAVGVAIAWAIGHFWGPHDGGYYPLPIVLFWPFVSLVGALIALDDFLRDVFMRDRP